MSTDLVILDPIQPSDTIRYQADFTDDMSSTESITSISLTVTKVSDSSDVTSTISQSYSESSGVVEFSLGDGTDGDTYYVDIVVTTDEGQELTLTGSVACTEVGG